MPAKSCHTILSTALKSQRGKWEQKSSEEAVFSAPPFRLWSGLRGYGIILIVTVETDRVTLWEPAPAAVVREILDTFPSGSQMSH